MDETQLLDTTWDGDEEDEVSSDKVFGWLEIDQIRHDIRQGETKIGRDFSLCKIAPSNKSLSKIHAIFHAEGPSCTLTDIGSRNKTKIGRMVLRPNIRYGLLGGEEITFGSLKALFRLNVSVVSDTESETGSESMLLKESSSNFDELSDDDCFIDPTPACSNSVNSSSAVLQDKLVSTNTPKSINDVYKKMSVPESPSVTESTPYQKKICSSICVPETPATPQEDLSASDIGGNDSSLFFEPSQPSKASNKMLHETSEKENIDVGENLAETQLYSPGNISKSVPKLNLSDLDDTQNVLAAFEENYSNISNNCIESTQDVLAAFNDSNVDNTQDVIAAFNKSAKKVSDGSIYLAANQRFSSKVLEATQIYDDCQTTQVFQEQDDVELPATQLFENESLPDDLPKPNTSKSFEFKVPFLPKKNQRGSY